MCVLHPRRRRAARARRPADVLDSSAWSARRRRRPGRHRRGTDHANSRSRSARRPRVGLPRRSSPHRTTRRAQCGPCPRPLSTEGSCHRYSLKSGPTLACLGNRDTGHAHLADMDHRARLCGTTVAANAFVFSLDPACLLPMRPEFMTRRMRVLRAKLGIDAGDFDATILAVRKWTSTETDGRRLQPIRRQRPPGTHRPNHVAPLLQPPPLRRPRRGRPPRSPSPRATVSLLADRRPRSRSGR